MPVTVQIRGVPITVTATDDRMEAQQMLQEDFLADPQQFANMVRQAAKQRQPRTGLSDEDIEAIVGSLSPRERGEAFFPQGAYAPETEGPGERFLIGAGQQMMHHTRGAAQLVNDAVETFDPSGQLSKQLGLEGSQKLAEDEAEARQMFNMLDSQGIGAEDAGQIVAESLAFLGGGSLALGKRALLGTAQGVLAGATAGRTSNESLAANTTISGAFGLVGQTFIGGLKGMLGLTRKSGAAVGNTISMMAAASRGNGFLFGSALGRFHMANNYAAKQLGAQAARATQRSPDQVAAAALARKARDVAGEIISNLKPRYQHHAAEAAAKKAFQAAIQNAQRVRGAAQTAQRQGFPVSQEGVQQFLPSKFVAELSSISDSQMRKLGPYGNRLIDFRNFARAIEDMDGISPQQVLNAIENIAENPEARRMITALQQAKTPRVRHSILARIATAGVTVPVRMTAGAPAAAGVAGAAQSGRSSASLFTGE